MTIGHAWNAAVRRTVAAVVAVSLVTCGCAAPERDADVPVPAANRSADPLRPWLSVAAVRIVAATDPLGMPLPRAPAQLGHLMHPVSAAMLGNDVYVLDAGLNGLFRYDISQEVLVRIGTITVAPGAKVRVLGDHTLLVLDPVGRRVLRLDRIGRILRVYADELNLRQPVAMAADETEQLLFVADGVLHRIVAFRLGTGAAFPIVPLSTERDRVHAISAIASADRVLHVVDPVMRQVVVLGYDGRILRVFGHGDLTRPHGIAVDAQGRTWVLDEGQPVLRLFEGGRMAMPIEGVASRLTSVADIAIGGGAMAIAESGARRVQVLRFGQGAARSR